MDTLKSLIQQAQATGDKFTKLRRMAEEIAVENTAKECLVTAKALFTAESYQARSLATYVFGHLAGHSKESLMFYGPA